MKDEFWWTFHEQVNLHAYDKIWRSKMDAHCRWHGWPLDMSGIKFMSYIGAVPLEYFVDEYSMPGDRLEKFCFKCPMDGSLYMDPGNWVYKRTLHFVWPRALPGFSNQKTIGDVLEAFLGFAYMQAKYKPAWRGTEQREFIRLLELVLSKVYLHWHFFEEVSWVD